MLKLALLFTFSFVFFTACSVLQKSGKEEYVDVYIDEDSFKKELEISVNEILNGVWLDSILNAKGERPVVMVGQFNLGEKIHFEKSDFYNQIDLLLLKSGDVRVVKTTIPQREKAPKELAKGKSVDVVLSTDIYREQKNETLNIIMQLKLWDGFSFQPNVQVNRNIDYQLQP